MSLSGLFTNLVFIPTSNGTNAEGFCLRNEILLTSVELSDNTGQSNIRVLRAPRKDNKAITSLYQRQ